MLKLALGVVVAFGIGAACRKLNVPVPAPPSLYGVLLIASITAGYLCIDLMLKR